MQDWNYVVGKEDATGGVLTMAISWSSRMHTFRSHSSRSSITTITAVVSNTTQEKGGGHTGLYNQILIASRQSFSVSAPPLHHHPRSDDVVRSVLLLLLWLCHSVLHRSLCFFFVFCAFSST